MYPDPISVACPDEYRADHSYPSAKTVPVKGREYYFGLDTGRRCDQSLLNWPLLDVVSIDLREVQDTLVLCAAYLLHEASYLAVRFLVAALWGSQHHGHPRRIAPASARYSLLLPQS